MLIWEFIMSRLCVQVCKLTDAFARPPDGVNKFKFYTHSHRVSHPAGSLILWPQMRVNRMENEPKLLLLMRA